MLPYCDPNAKVFSNFVVTRCACATYSCDNGL